jgi:hypothetical protein
MKDSVLKKEFQKRDVERLRNLVKGKHGDRTIMGIGYNGEIKEDHKEGDIWEEKGKTWTIRDGIKENVTKLDKIKKAAVPLFCPKCKHVMDKQLDAFYFKAYNECLDCRTKTETQMKIAGTWDDHRIKTFNAEIDQQIQEYKKWFENVLQDTADGYVSENGEVQKWVGGIDKERAQHSLDEVIKYLTSLKK